MQIVLTVVLADQESWDAVVDVENDTPVSSLIAAAAASAGEPPVRLVCYRGDQELDPRQTVADSGLLPGEHLGLGSPVVQDPPVRPDGGPSLEVHAVGGVDAGRVWPIGFGSYDIGSAPGCRIPLVGQDIPDRPLTLTVDRTGAAWLTGLPTPSVDARSRLTDAVPPPRASQAGYTTAARTAGTSRPGRTSNPNRGRTETPGRATIRRDGKPDRLATNRTTSSRRTATDPGAAGRTHADAIAGPADAREWPLGVDLVIGDHVLRLATPFTADAAVTPSDERIGLDVNRPPRIVPPLLYPPIKLPAPPTPPSRRPFPLLLTLSPMVLGLAFVYFFHSYFFLLIAFMSPIMGLANWYSDRRNGRRQYRRDVETYRQRRHDAELAVERAVGEERIARQTASPDPALAGLIASRPGRRLWERRRSDPDFLVLRIGTSDQPSLMELEDPAREDRSGYRWTVPGAPVGIDLVDRGVVGVAGDAEATGEVGRWLISQAAILHSPRDLRLHLLTTGTAPNRWDWIRWLPHVRPQTPGGGPWVNIGNDPETIVHRVGELTGLVRARTEARSSQLGPVLFSEPDVVVVLDGARQLRDVPGVMQLLTDGPRVRVFAICLDAQERLLPEECTSVIRCDPGGLVLRQTNAPDVTAIRVDQVTLTWCDRSARSLAALRDVTPDNSGGSLPDRVRLLDLLRLDPPDPQVIADSWLRRPASTTFPIGSGFDGPLQLDLVRDGPHALVAGTTGSGKSELLQTLVASLAASNRPDELVFVLVDYKGGSAFHSCVSLPHTLGMVTDLDEALSLRALDSLAAELRRREQLLARTGAKDLPEYRALRTQTPNLPALPRLLLVIDEFATMARETPSFVPGLVSIAQRGRSLGIHLLLATQRPAGVVTADIKANTNLRIALRVTDPGESLDVIDVKDAAHISTGTPGRALARLAHRSSVPFQTAFVGGSMHDSSQQPIETSVSPVELTRLAWSGLGRPAPPPSAREIDGLELPGRQRTDLDALVEAIRGATDLVEVEPQPRPWLPALDPIVLLDDLRARLSQDPAGAEATPWAAVRPAGAVPIAPFALTDLPSAQRQDPAAIDLATMGHLFIIGAPRSGRSQALRTLAGTLVSSASVADLHLYGIDAAGGSLSVLSELPHCGAVVPRTDLERLDRLVARLTEALAERQELMSKHSAGNLTELRASLPAADRPAHLVVLVDGWDAMSGLLMEHDGGHLHAAVVGLLREGASAGIHLVMTSERSLAIGRLATLAEDKLMLRMTDRTDYLTLGLSAHRIPEVIPSGRAWRADGTEIQIALLAADPSGQAQTDALRAIGQTARKAASHVPDSRQPFEVAVLPSSVTFTEAFALVPAEARRPLRGLIGLSGSTLGPVTVDFAGAGQSFLIAGPAGSGRSTALAALAVSLLASGTRLVILTPRESPLRRLEAHDAVTVHRGLDLDPAELTQQLDGALGPTVLLLDDVDLVPMGHPLDPVLRDVVARGRDRGTGLAFAGSAEAMGQSLGGWMGEAKRSRQGILLAPQTSLEGDLLGIRLPQSALRSGIRPGRGYMTGPPVGGLRTIVIPHTVLR